MAETAEAALSGTAPDPGYQARYPWHADLWVRLTADPARLSHALLLHGPSGLGKRAFAWRLAHSLLCLAPGKGLEACTTCTSCRRFLAGTHPDLMSIELAEDTSAIAIDQVRAVRDFVVLRPHTATRKLVIIDPADRMSTNAANALLKILEEPPEGSMLLLVTSQLARLPATIRSRCALVAFRVPEERLALGWLSEQGASDPSALLRFAAGAPLHAVAAGASSDIKDRSAVIADLEMLRKGAGDPLACASRWKNYGAERCLTWFQMYLADLLRQDLTEDKLSMKHKELFDYFDLLSNTRALADGPLDETLLLEDLLIRWAGIFRGVV